MTKKETHWQRGLSSSLLLDLRHKDDGVAYSQEVRIMYTDLEEAYEAFWSRIEMF